MALDVGQCRTDAPPVAGVSGRLWLALGTRAGWAGMVTPLTEGTAVRNAISALLESVAHAIVRSLTDDMVVTVTIPADAFGLGVPAIDTPFVAVVT